MKPVARDGIALIAFAAIALVGLALWRREGLAIWLSDVAIMCGWG